jgi:hypothetical protein
MQLRAVILVAALLALPALAVAQEPGRVQLPDFPALSQRAKQAVDVSLDPSMLGQVGTMIDNNGGDGAALSEVIHGIRGIYVRSYSFDKPGEYSAADVDAVRAQLHAPDWQQVVSTHDLKQGNNVDIYVRRDGKRTDGLIIIAAQPRELAIVNIVGSIDLARLAQLQGQFGIPQVGLGAGGAVH